MGHQVFVSAVARPNVPAAAGVKPEALPHVSVTCTTSFANHETLFQPQQKKNFFHIYQGLLI